MNLICQRFNMIEEIKDLFYQEKYSEVIKIYNQLNEKEIYDFKYLYYGLLSCIGLDDIYLALSMIKKYPLISEPEIKSYLEEDGANFINLLKLEEDIQKTLFVCLYLQGNKDNESILKNIEANINYFELIGSLYELGYNNNVIKELTNIGHMIFKI